MTQRIAIGGFLHESHSFAPRPTTYADFVHPAGFPPLHRGRRGPRCGARHVGPRCGRTCRRRGGRRDRDPARLDLRQSCRTGAGRGIRAHRRPDLRRTLARAGRRPAGRCLSRPARRAHWWRAFPDAEGELLRRVRAIVGNTPVTISLDPHANLTARMVTLADAVVPFRTYPHVDMKQAGAQAMRLLLQRIERGMPWARAFRQLDFWSRSAVSARCCSR